MFKVCVIMYVSYIYFTIEHRQCANLSCHDSGTQFVNCRLDVVFNSPFIGKVFSEV